MGQAQAVGSQSSCGWALRPDWLTILPRCRFGPGQSQMAEISQLSWPTLLETLTNFIHTGGGPLGSISGSHGYKTKVSFLPGSIYSIQAGAIRVLLPVCLPGDSRWRIRVRAGPTKGSGIWMEIRKREVCYLASGPGQGRQLIQADTERLRSME